MGYAWGELPETSGALVRLKKWRRCPLNRLIAALAIATLALTTFPTLAHPPVAKDSRAGSVSQEVT